MGVKVGARPCSFRSVSGTHPIDYGLSIDERGSNRKIENFIRTKYESKRWVMDGPMPDPATLDVGDDDVVSYLP